MAAVCGNLIRLPLGGVSIYVSDVERSGKQLTTSISVQRPFSVCVLWELACWRWRWRSSSRVLMSKLSYVALDRGQERRRRQRWRECELGIIGFSSKNFHPLRNVGDWRTVPSTSFGEGGGLRTGRRQDEGGIKPTAMEEQEVISGVLFGPSCSRVALNRVDKHTDKEGGKRQLATINDVACMNDMDMTHQLKASTEDMSESTAFRTSALLPLEPARRVRDPEGVEYRPHRAIKSRDRIRRLHRYPETSIKNVDPTLMDAARGTTIGLVILIAIIWRLPYKEEVIADTPLTRVTSSSLHARDGTNVVTYEDGDSASNLEIISKMPVEEQLLGHFFYEEAPEEQLVQVPNSRRIYLRKAASEAFCRMREEARNDDIFLVPLSGFRSVQEQEEIFFGMMSSRNQDAVERAKVSAPPGFSEHHTGYALDIGDGRASRTHLEEEFEETAAFSWLLQNGKRFHFELSFLRNNEQGIMYEPWHWRFVGDSHSLKTFYFRKPTIDRASGNSDLERNSVY